MKNLKSTAEPRLRRTGQTLSRKGAMLPLLAAMIMGFLVMEAFSVDVAYMQLVRTQLRVATDAAAKAGAEALARTQTESAGRAAAIVVAQQNSVGGDPLQLASADVTFGRVTQNDNGKWRFHANQTPFTAVSVNGRRTADSLSGAVPLFFAGVFGGGGFTPVHTATATHLENEIVIAVDRSHSMCFDMTGVSWGYTPNNPLPSILSNPQNYQQWQLDLTSPPHPTGSRWSALGTAVDVFLDEVALVSKPPRVSLVTWASGITSSSYEGSLSGRTSPLVTLDTSLSLTYGPVRTAIENYGQDVMFGGTDIAAGIDESVVELTSAAARPLANKSIVLMTDGQWTHGRDPRLAAADAGAAGVVIYTVTFLDAADQSVMQQVATSTGGRHFHASNATQLRDAFQEIARSLPVALVQ